MFILAAKRGVTVLNSPGTVDADYRGEVKVLLINHSDKDFEIKYGDRIAQLIITKYEKAKLEFDDNISETEIVSLNIPTGVPLVYELDEELKPIKHYYLGDPEEAAKKAAAVANQAKVK